MIPQPVVDLTNGPYIAYLGSCNEQLTPTVRMALGIDVKATENIVTIFVFEAHHKQMLKNLQHNGRLALSFSQLSTHVAYQLKGAFLQARLLNEDEAIGQQQYRSKMIGILIEMGFPETPVNTVMHPADLALEFKVEKIFNQTPGPGAGKEIVF